MVSDEGDGEDVVQRGFVWNNLFDDYDLVPYRKRTIPTDSSRFAAVAGGIRGGDEERGAREPAGLVGPQPVMWRGRERSVRKH